MWIPPVQSLYNDRPEYQLLHMYTGAYLYVYTGCKYRGLWRSWQLYARSGGLWQSTFMPLCVNSERPRTRRYGAEEGAHSLGFLFYYDATPEHRATMAPQLTYGMGPRITTRLRLTPGVGVFLGSISHNIRFYSKT